MFRQASRLLSRSIAAGSSKSATARAFSTEVPSTIDRRLWSHGRKSHREASSVVRRLPLHEASSVDCLFNSDEAHVNFVLP
ncbi:hypothetical protein Bca4012_049545 [Brassica carinata]